MGSRQSIFKKIRVPKEGSAFVYAILESYEGICTTSTLGFKNGDRHRDLELRVPPDYLEEVNRVLRSLGDLVYDLDPSSDAGP